ncbi:hypothetical protein DL96DRAFT_1594556 [Flagelloscypha sp. PMI_526]|nr:hypothetical protein DL96DRAFT_1594556 [Flagelloscypha sp. PMI_526]
MLVTEEKLSSVRSEILALEQAADALNGPIGELRRAIHQLEAQKLNYLSEAKQLRGTITLARRLPVDLLADIFRRSAEHWPSCPHIVSQVCSEWRTSASVPSCWSHIWVKLDSPKAETVIRALYWLQRANVGPLHLTIEIQRDTPNITRTIAILLSHSHRWKTLFVVANFVEHVNAILQLCVLPCPQLISVSVSISEESSLPESDIHGLRTALGFNTSNLQSIHLVRDVLPSPSSLPANLSRLDLTVLCHDGTATPLEIHSLLQILENLPSLSTFKVGLPTEHTRTFTAPTATNWLRFPAPALRSLSLTGDPTLFQLLYFFTAPLLTELHLQSSVDPLGSPHEATGEAMLCFLEHSMGVEVLGLRDIDIPVKAFEQVLPLLSQLKFLRLHDSEITDEVIHNLTDTSLCPILEGIDIRWCGMLTGGVLSRLVEARHSSPCPISTMTILNCSGVTEKDILGLSCYTQCYLSVFDLEDECYIRKCCVNKRYTQRFRARQGTQLKVNWRNIHL